MKPSPKNDVPSIPLLEKVATVALGIIATLVPLFATKRKAKKIAVDFTQESELNFSDATPNYSRPVFVTVS